MLDLLKGRKIIYYDCFRSDNGNPLHFRKPSPGQLGQDVLIEALLLSRCNALVHTYSNVSTGALYFNPTAKHVLVRQDW
ncbi:MAG: hypothetical protein P4L31_01810, partial [Candidatus Babeliales bacterium]|nr:hypothetical protein [Candidatus Babeliales bacterium]